MMELLLMARLITLRSIPANLTQSNNGCCGSLFVFINCSRCLVICFFISSKNSFLVLGIKNGKFRFHVSKHEGQALPSEMHNTTSLYMCQQLFLQISQMSQKYMRTLIQCFRVLYRSFRSSLVLIASMIPFSPLHHWE